MNMIRRSTMTSLVCVICYLSCLLLCCYYVSATTKTNDSPLWKSFIDSDVYRNIYSDVPTLFSNNNEVKYDRYAACLAATEGLRRIRDCEITSIRNKRRHKKDDTSCSFTNRAEKNIQSQFLKNSKQILDFHGITPRSFASLSKKLMYNEELKQKVCKY